MALQRLRGVGVGSSLASTKRSVCCCAFKQQAPQYHAVKPSDGHTKLASQLLAAGLAIGMTLSGPTPVMAATQYNSLADIVRSSFSFVDDNKDGVITRDELLRTSKAVAEDVEFPLPDQGQLDFAMKLFDLNQDGTLTTDELLASIALDEAIDDDGVDEAVVRVFDKNGDGFVTLPEFKAGIPPLGPNGEAAKEYIFGRVDQVVDGDKKLDPQEFQNALTIVRTAVLGY